MERPDFGKILDFFKDEQTRDLVSRQHALLKRIVKSCRTGFTLRELPVVAELLELVSARIGAMEQPDDAADLEKTLCKTVRLCGMPAIREKSNEELLAPGLAAAETILRRLESLLHSGSPRVAIEATRALHVVARGEAEGDAERGGGRQNATAAKQLNRRLLLKAQVVEGAVAELRTHVEQLLAIDDDGTAAVVAEAISKDVDGESSDEDESADARRHKKKKLGKGGGSGGMSGHRLSAAGARAGTPFGGALVFSTAPRTLAFAELQLLLALVKLLRELSTSYDAAGALVRCGGMGVCISVLRLFLHDPLGSEPVAVAVEVLWNALEHSAVAVNAAGPPAPSRTELLARRRENNAMWHLADDTALAVLRQLLTALFVHGRRAVDKQLRNEVLIVSSLIASHRKSHKPFRTQNLLQLLLQYATASELPEDSIEERTRASSKGSLWDPDKPPLADRHNFATGSPEDLEMKRILWALLSDLGRQDQANLELIVKADFMGALLMYLDVDSLEAVDEPSFEESMLLEGPGSPADGDPGDAPEPAAGAPRRRIPTTLRRLPLTQLHVLQQQAMAVLLNLAPRAPAAFQALQGHILALRFLDACDDTGGGGGAPKSEPKVPKSASGLIQGALMLLISVVGLPGLQDELGHLDAVRIMLRRFTDKSANNSLRADAVQILSKLCEGHVGNQTSLRRLDGISALVDELEIYCSGRSPAPRLRHPPPGGGGDDDGGGSGIASSSATEKVTPITVGVLDCVWNAVVGNKRSEARLPPAHGIDALLSMLEVGPRLMRHQVCGVLADLARNGKLVPYVRAWRSDRSMRSASQLLAHVWEDEEIRLGCDREHGILSNLQQPLRRQRGLGGAAAADDAGSPSRAQPPPPGDSSDDESLRAPPPPPSPGSPDGKATTKFVRKAQGGGLQTSMAAKAERAMRQAVGACDLRAKIAPIVELLGHEDAADGIPAEDRATLCMVRHYEQFCDGESWAEVRDQLRAAGVKPIAADAKLLELKLGACAATAEATQAEQKVLAGEREDEERNTEAAYLGTILLQRDQEIRQLAIKRNALVPKSLQQKRRAEKAKQHAEATGEAHPSVDATTSGELSSTLPPP